MSRRLLWNFEIKPADLSFPDLNAVPADSNETLQWESRFFWPENEIITLDGLDETYLNLSSYTYKHREDTYYLLDTLNLNIKQRGDKLLYKPILAQSDGVVGFGKKINLNTEPADSQLPGLDMPTPISTAQLLTLMETGALLTVSKEAAIYRFPSNPVLKLELSRLTIRSKTYFSLCLESNSANSIRKMAAHLLHEQHPCHYVTFLRMQKNLIS